MEGGAGNNLAERFGALDLTVEETKAVELDDEGLKNALVAKVLSRRPVNYRALTSTLGDVWGTSAAMKHKQVGTNLILFSFSDSRDMKRVLNEGPWNFDNKPIIFVEYDGRRSPSGLDFSYLPVWVRIYDLPLSIMNDKKARTIGGMFGEVLDVDVDGDGCAWGEFLRIWVRIDINKPLRRGVLIKTPSAKNSDGDWFGVRYEKLPHFCFFCGLLGHEICECENGAVPAGTPPKYGADLRAQAGKRSMGKDHFMYSSGPNRKSNNQKDSNEKRSDGGSERGEGRDGMAADEAQENMGAIPRVEVSSRVANNGDLREGSLQVVSGGVINSEVLVRGPESEGEATRDSGTSPEPKKKILRGHGLVRRRLVRGKKLDRNKNSTLQIMQIDSPVSEEIRVGKKRKGVDDDVGLALMIGEDGGVYDVERTGPKQKKKKEVLLSALTHVDAIGSAPAAAQQSRRDQ